MVARQLEGMMCAMRVDKERLDGIPAVAAWTRRAGEVVNAVVRLIGDLGPERLRHVLGNELQPVTVLEVIEITGLTGEKIVGNYHQMTLSHQSFDEVAPHKSGAAGNEYAHWYSILTWL
jgi:hypothetical protein